MLMFIPENYRQINIRNRDTDFNIRALLTLSIPEFAFTHQKDPL